MKYNNDSVYRLTPIVGGKLSTFVPPVESLEEYNLSPLTIEAKYEHRPDKLAYDLYGNSKLWWVFAQFNQDILLDPIMDFKADIVLYVPQRFV